MRCLFLFTVFLLLVTSAGLAAEVAWPGLEPRDWEALDEQLDRPLLVRLYMFTDATPDELHVQYEKLAAQPLTYQPVSLDEFAGLGGPERQRRAREAARLRDQARESLAAIDRVRDAGLTNHALKSLPDGRSDRGTGQVPRAMGGLGAAVAADPRDPVAWFDLAYWAGLVGDEDRQERALQGFRTAVAAADLAVQEALFPQRIQVELDQAWLHRRRGELEEGLAATLRASQLMKADPAPNGAASREAHLVAALLHAECGDVDQARILAQPLTEMTLRRRNRIAHNDPRPDSFAATELRTMPLSALTGQGLWARGIPAAYQPVVPAQKGAWENFTSDWARNWVLALVELRYGNLEGALQQLSPFDPLVEYPGRLGYRLWNDRGRVCEAAGDRTGARRCNALAVVHRPFFIFYPIEGMRGVARTVDPAERGFSYFLGGGEFFGGGSLFSYAANCLLTWELETIPDRKQRMGELAERWLTACVRRHIRQPLALALRGRLRFLQGRSGPAEVDLLQAAELNVQQDRRDPEVPLLLGLINFNTADYAGALPWLQQFTEQRPEVGVGWRALGLTRVFLGELEAGEAALTRSVDLEPQNPGGWFNRALVRLKLGDRPGVLADLDRAAELVPDNPDIPRIREAATAGPLPEVGLNATPITLTASREEARLLARLQRGAGLNLAAETGAAAGTPAGGWQMDEAEAQDRLADLRKAYRFDPSRRNLEDLARALLTLDHAREVQRMLAPHFEGEIGPASLIMLLEADRRLGDGERAIALAHGLPATAMQYPEPEVWAQVGAICMAAGRRELGLKALAVGMGQDAPGSAPAEAAEPAAAGRR